MCSWYVSPAVIGQRPQNRDSGNRGRGENDHAARPEQPKIRSPPPIGTVGTGGRDAVGHGPALLLMEANGG